MDCRKHYTRLVLEGATCNNKMHPLNYHFIHQKFHPGILQKLNLFRETTTFSRNRGILQTLRIEINVRCALNRTHHIYLYDTAQSLQFVNNYTSILQYRQVCFLINQFIHLSSPIIPGRVYSKFIVITKPRSSVRDTFSS